MQKIKDTAKSFLPKQKSGAEKAELSFQKDLDQFLLNASEDLHSSDPRRELSPIVLKMLEDQEERGDISTKSKTALKIYRGFQKNVSSDVIIAGPDGSKLIKKGENPWDEERKKTLDDLSDTSRG